MFQISCAVIFCITFPLFFILNILTIGGLAGALGTFVTTPLDVIRTRLIAQDNRRGYTSMLHATKTILRADGVSGLYRGLIPGIMQVTPLTGINFMFYNWLGSTTVEVMKLESKRFDQTYRRDETRRKHFASLYFSAIFRQL